MHKADVYSWVHLFGCTHIIIHFTHIVDTAVESLHNNYNDLMHFMYTRSTPDYAMLCMCHHLSPQHNRV
jgi:hypothetical protein